jgi:XTP/dITP diphosphohydrolase
MTTLLIATRNAHKVGEIAAILGPGFHCRPLLQEFPAAPVPVEDADTFAGNAAKKAVSLAQWLGDTSHDGAMRGTWVLADDSGLEVDALRGAPGVHSARFAALDTGHPGNSPDADNNAKLLRLLAEVPSASTQRNRAAAAALATTRCSSRWATSSPSRSWERA